MEPGAASPPGGRIRKSQESVTNLQVCGGDRCPAVCEVKRPLTTREATVTPTFNKVKFSFSQFGALRTKNLPSHQTLLCIVPHIAKPSHPQNSNHQQPALTPSERLISPRTASSYRRVSDLFITSPCCHVNRINYLAASRHIRAGGQSEEPPA